MKLFFLIFSTWLSIPSFSQKSFDNNSISHLTVGVSVGALSSSYIGRNNKQRIIIGTFSGLMFGIAKEVNDNKRTKGSASVGDIISTTAGGMIGSLIINNTIKRNILKKRVKKVKECKM